MRWPGPFSHSHNEHCHNQKGESSAPFHFFIPPHNPPLRCSLAAVKHRSPAPACRSAARLPSGPPRHVNPTTARTAGPAPAPRGRVPPQVGRSAARPGRPHVRTAAGRPRSPGAGARPSPAGPRSPPGPRPAPLATRSTATEAASAPAPARSPVRRPRPLPTSLDTPLMPGRRVRSRPCGPLGAARRLSGCHQRPIGAPIRPDRPPPGPAQPMSPTARPAVSPPSPRHRPAPTGSGTPGTHPRPPRKFPAGACAARTLCRAYARVSDFGDLDFGIENWAIRDPRLSGNRAMGPARSKRADGNQKLSACSDGTRRAMVYAWRGKIDCRYILNRREQR